MEAALTEVCKDIRVGKILIQTSPESGEPGMYWFTGALPNDTWLFLIFRYWESCNQAWSYFHREISNRKTL